MPNYDLTLEEILHNKAIRTQIITMLKAGEIQSTIAKKFNCSVYAVGQIRKRYNLPSRREMNDRRKQRICELYKKGVPVEQIASEVSFSVKTVRDTLHDYGMVEKKSYNAPLVGQHRVVKCKCPYCKQKYTIKALYDGDGLWWRYCDKCSGKSIASSMSGSMLFKQGQQL